MARTKKIARKNGSKKKEMLAEGAKESKLPKADVEVRPSKKSKKEPSKKQEGGSKEGEGQATVTEA